MADGQYVIGTCDGVTGPPTQSDGTPAVQPAVLNTSRSRTAHRLTAHPRHRYTSSSGILPRPSRRSGSDRVAIEPRQRQPGGRAMKYLRVGPPGAERPV